MTPRKHNTIARDTYNLIASQNAAYTPADGQAARSRNQQQRGGGGGAGFAQGILPSNSQPLPSDDSQVRPGGIVSCPELLRIAIALHFGLLIRLWLVLVSIARQTNRTGFTRDEIKNVLQQHHVKFSGRNLSRWLRIGLTYGFWTYDTQTGRYYHRGYLSLSEYLVGLCESKGLHALYLTNFPGQRRPMLINVASDNLRQFEQNVYSAWVASRENLMISRIQLMALWNRTAPAIRQWEGQGGVTPQANYTFTDEVNHPDIPRQADGAWRRDVHRRNFEGRDVLSWQLPNRYLAPPTPQHPRKGQLRRVHTSMHRYIRMMKAAGVCEQGTIPGGLNLNVRRYHASAKGAAQSHKRYGLRPRYIFRGRWGERHGYYEYAPDARVTLDYFTCRRLFRREQIVCLAKRGNKIVGGETAHPF